MENDDEPGRENVIRKILIKPGHEILRQTNGVQAHMWHMATGISAEAGCILDVVKKHAVCHESLDRNTVIERLGAIEIYLEGLRRVVGATQQETLDAKIAGLRKQYPVSPRKDDGVDKTD